MDCSGIHYRIDESGSWRMQRWDGWNMDLDWNNVNMNAIKDIGQIEYGIQLVFDKTTRTPVDFYGSKWSSGSERLLKDFLE